MKHRWGIFIALHVAVYGVLGYLFQPASANQIDLFKVIYLEAAAGIIVFVATYTRLVDWWRDTIGQTIVVKDLLLLVPILLGLAALFLHFSRLTSQIASGIGAGSIGSIGAVMFWRTAVWVREGHETGSEALPGPEGKEHRHDAST